MHFVIFNNIEVSKMLSRMSVFGNSINNGK